MPTVNCVTHGIEFVNDLVRSIRIAGQRLIAARLVAAGDVAAQMCIGPVVDQILDQFVIALLRSAVKGGNSDNITLINVGSALDQQFERLEAVVARGQEKSGFSLVIQVFRATAACIACTLCPVTSSCMSLIVGSRPAVSGDNLFVVEVLGSL